ncbi:bacteriocin-associated integral membrane family protein [Nocardiopsis sp. SBT366]|uniref:bacteriocin-associated integral membrane family protein n=1 Tax=Nocardiopsis sp. SBT366 TaxID=1580529 RepID=UPI00066B2C8C|nr:hypothetical protein [Nocardiopsis sp. SBT366]
MPNRTLSFAYTACVAFAALLAFLLAATAEQTVHVLDDPHLVWITESDGTHDTDEVARSVQEVADAHDAAIGYSVLDVHTPSSLAHLYLAVSDPGSRYGRWLDEGYPSFSRSFAVLTHPISEFGDVGPHGYYLVFGAPEAAPALREALAEHGLSEAPGMQRTQLWHFLASGHLLHLVAVAMLTTVTATGAGVLLDSRDHAVRRLQGHSYGRLLAGELLGVLRLWALVLPVSAVAVLGLLGVHNGGNQIGFYSLLALVFLAALTLACLLTHAVFLALVGATGILPALRGRLPVRGTVAAVYLVRVPALALTLVLLGSVVTTAREAREQGLGVEVHDAYGQTSRPALSANYGWADDQAVDDTLGPWLRRTDADADLVLAAQMHPSEIVPSVPGSPAVLDNPVLLVNDTYLDEEEVLSPTGRPYGSAGTVRVLLPSSASGHSGALVEGVTGWLGVNGAPGEGFDVRVLPAADEQTLFTYGAEERLGGTLPLLYEPVLIVLPNGAVLSDNSYVNHMSARQTVFPDPGVVEAFRARSPEASRYVSMVETLGTSARRAHALTVNALHTETFNLVGAGAVLLLTAMAACVVHARTRDQEIFARHISGWGFLATHRRLLTVEAALALAFVGWAVVHTAARLSAPDDPARPPTDQASWAEPLHAAGIALASLTLTLGVLAFLHRRVVREGATRA